MTVSVVVPRAGDCPHRERAWQWIRRRYGDVEIVEGWGDPDRWSKADAVADALERATGDLLVVADADVWSEQLEPIITAVADGAPWGTPHTHVRRLTEIGTIRFMAGEREEAPTEEEHFAQVGGGIVVLPRATYERIPLDPRFIGWGGEDKSWARALRLLAGPPARQHAALWHLWHPPQPRLTRTVGSAANVTLAGRYADASSNRMMRALIEEGRTWRSQTSSPSR